MASDLEDREATPPLKRRRTESNSPRRGSHDDAREQGTRSQDQAAREGSWANRAMSKSPAERQSRDKYYSPSRASSRSRSPRRSNSRSRSRLRSESASRSRSRSRSRFQSPSNSRSRSWAESPRTRDQSRSQYGSRSQSVSSERSRSEYLSPRPAQSISPRELPKLNYKPRLVLHGHTSAISQVRISPDGRFIASASADGTLKIWDASTGIHMDTLVGHMAGVSCVAWSPDSNTLASGSDDKAIRLWDRVTGRPKTTTRKSMSGQEMAPLRGHHNYIHCLAFSPKGNILASGSYDEAVFLWDVRAGRLMRSLPAHSDPVSGIDFCRDGTLVVSCSTDGLM